MFRHHPKQILTALLVIALSSPGLSAWAVQYKLEAIDFNPVTQSLVIKSTGPVQAMVNSVNIGRNKRIILDIENTEIGLSIPRDALLLQQLASQWGAIKNISVNQFGGTQPVVRILLDVEGTAYTPQLTVNKAPQVELKIASSAPQVVQQVITPLTPAPQPISGASSTAPPSSIIARATDTRADSSTVSTQEMKQALVTLNDRYDQLQRENQSLKTQLRQAQQSGQSSSATEAELRRLRDANQSLQTQLSNLYTEQNTLKQQLQSSQGSPTAVADLQSKLTALQNENRQLSSQLAEAKKAVAPKPLATQPSTTPISDPQLAAMKKQVDEAKTALNRSIATINQQNGEIASLKNQLDQLKSGIDSTTREQLTALNSRLDEKNSRIQTLEAQVASLNQQLTAVDPTALDQLQRQLAQKDTQIADLNQQLSQKETALVSLNRQLSDLQMQAVNASDAVNLRRQLDQLDGQYKTTVAEFNKRLEESRQTQARADELARQVSDLKSELRESNTKYQQVMQELTSAKSGADQLSSDRQKRDAEIQSWKTKNAQLEQQVSSLTATVKQLENQTKGNSTHDNQLVRENKRLTDLVELMKKDSQTMATEKQALKAQLENLGTENKKLTANLTAALNGAAQKNDSQEMVLRLTEELEGLKADKQQWQKVQRALQSEKETLQEQVAELKKSLAIAEKSSKSDTSNVAEKPASTRATSASQSVSIKKLHELESKIEKLQGENENLKALNKSLFAEVSAKTGSPSIDPATGQPASPATEKQVAELKAQLKDMMADLDGMRADKLSLLAQLDEMKANNKKLTEGQPVATAFAATETNTDAEMNKLKQQLADTQARYKKVLADYDKLQREAKNPTTSNSSSTKPVAQVTDNTTKNTSTSDKIATEVATLKEELRKLSSQNEKLQAQLQAELKKQAANKAVASAPAPAISNDASAEAEKHYQLAQDFDTNSQKDLALEEYQRALKLNPGSSKYVYAVAGILAQRQQYGEAISLLQEYIDSHPYESDAFNSLGKVYLLSGQPEQAQRAFAKAIPVGSLNNYATTLKKQGKLVEAEQVFKTAVALNPGDSELLFNLGNIYNARNNLQDAKETYAQALMLNPQFAEAHYNLGLVFSKMGDKQSAVTHLEKFLELSPNANNADVIRNYVKKLKS